VQRTRKPAPQLTKTPRAQLTETPRPCAQGDKAVHAPQHALDDYLSRGMGGNDMVMGAQCAAPAPVVPFFFLLLLLSARGHPARGHHHSSRVHAQTRRALTRLAHSCARAAHAGPSRSGTSRNPSYAVSALSVRPICAPPLRPPSTVVAVPCLLRAPCITAVNGLAVGGGANIALANYSDLVICSSKVRAHG
jgi:hypothetical protein